MADSLVKYISFKFLLISTLYLRGLPNSADLRILLNSTNIRFPLTFTRDLKIILNYINRF